ncbi:MAG: carbohydrate-binding module family 20 domain-containing protein [Myxococcales bacterium]
MNSLLRCLAVVSLVGLPACGGALVESEDGIAESTADLKYAANYRTLYLRGTFNSWKKTAMKLVGDHQWQGEATFAAPGSFKFDAAGDWKTNFGDNDLDQIADAAGKDIAVDGGGKTYRISFNDESRFYFVQEKAYTATVNLSLPAGADKLVFAGQTAHVAKDGEGIWTVGLYADADHATPYCPLPGLSKGSTYTFTLDLVVGGKRYLAEKSFTVDGKKDEFTVAAPVTEGSLADYGTVVVTVWADGWQNDALVQGTWGETSIYLGDWRAGNVLGRTLSDGTLTVTVPAGEQVFSTMTMTSSHSVASGSANATVVAGQTVHVDIHIASLTVVIRAHYDCGSGNALYVTGASSYLGDWQTAQKMTWDASRGVWTLYRNLPVGLPFKIVRGPWVDGETIPTSQTAWEQGDNHTVTPPNGYYQSELDFYPTF